MCHRREGDGCGRGGALSTKKSFVLKMMFGCILTLLLTGRKHGQSLEALGHGFYSSVAKQKQCKHCPKIHSQTRRTVTPSPPPLSPKYSTGVVVVIILANVLRVLKFSWCIPDILKFLLCFVYNIFTSISL